MRTLLALLFAACPVASGQLVSFGFKGGVPLDDAYSRVRNFIPDLTQNTTTHRYLFGPALEVRLPLHLAIEADALYRSSEYGYSYTLLNTPFRIKNTVRNLEFPVLLKWYVLPGPLRPFVDGGVTYRHVYLTDKGVASSPDSAGGTVGLGLLFKAGPIRISPEIRYTRWGASPIIAPNFRSVRDQSDFLLSVHF